MKEKDGSSRALTEQSEAARYQDNVRRISGSCSNFSPNYSLEDGARYVLKFTVTSSQDALDVKLAQ